MALSKVEVNLIRLLEAAPRQQNQAKLLHYVTTARELLEQLGAETTPEGISSVSKAKISEYSEKIEALAVRLAAPEPENEMPIDENREEESSFELEKAGSPISLSSGLRRRPVAHTEVGPSSHESKDRDIGAPIKLDAEAQAHIEKHRKLQEDLTDEMVDLARQLKESSLTMHQSVQETEKILDSTERAVEHSLASTGRATTRAAEVYSLASKTTCFQWLLIFMMTCMFIMVVLLIRRPRSIPFSELTESASDAPAHVAAPRRRRRPLASDAPHTGGKLAEEDEYPPLMAAAVAPASSSAGWDFTCDFEIDYGSEEHASIVYKTLAVDKELQPDKVKREMSVSGGKLIVHFEAVEARFLRASFSAFVDLTVLVTKLVEEYGISKEGDGSI
uniref:Uncharacterized protein n=1 Tax=Leersia perrieri TaxID=77586 RepID=A0A0D9XA65_9ORYZ